MSVILRIVNQHQPTKKMAQLTSVVDPYGEVNVFTENDESIRIKATVLMKPEVEGAQTGLAIDGSKSMADLFGGKVAVSSIFASDNNLVEPVARTMAEYLAKLDSDGKTDVIYWACGNFGDKIQIIGELTAEEAIKTNFPKPEEMGTGTKLIPAIRYFTEERFSAAPWGIYLFVTDGLIEDIEDVKAYTKELCESTASGNRGFTKLVIIGLGAEFYYKNQNTGQILTSDQIEGRIIELETDDNWLKSAAWQALETLDDLADDPAYGNIPDSNGEIIDIWDHKLVATMKSLEEIFAEVVSKNMHVAPSAEILDSYGNPVIPIDRKSYADGLPALIEFLMPKESTSFTLRLPNGTEVVQLLSST